MKNLFYIFVSLFCLLFISACDKFEEYKINREKRIEQEKIEREKQIQRETVERHKSWTRQANINGIPVLMPSCVSMERVGDPAFLSPEWKNVDLKTRGKSTYQTSARLIGFEFEFKQDLLRQCVKDDVFIGDNEYYAKDFLNPQSAWVNVILFADEQDSGNATTMNPEHTFNFNGNNHFTRWMKIGEIFGLEHYQLRYINAPERGPKPERIDAIFLSRDSDGNVLTIITCDNERDYKGTTDFQHCWHETIMPDLNAQLRLMYLRVHLEHWQEIQQVAEKNIRSWIVEPNQVR
ncbi:MAG: hypothetical protein IJ187_06930 [Neisseriaceae bacterium]|nr:hypothetical protein [Neisseriaceae bacterium]MBQ9724667.1 hypothetical protein [Neisseriaceae bacterium]